MYTQTKDTYSNPTAHVLMVSAYAHTNNKIKSISTAITTGKNLANMYIHNL